MTKYVKSGLSRKPGNEIRKIVSAVGFSTDKLAKWLFEQFKSTEDLTGKLSNI